MALAAAVCIAMLAAWLWSRDGAATTITITVTDSEYTLGDDGRSFRGEMAGPTSGGIIVQIEEYERLPSVAASGIDSVRVTARNGAELLREDFSGDRGQWSASANIRLDSGHAVLADPRTGRGRLAFDAPSWTDYRVEVVARNAQAVSVYTRVQADGTSVVHRAQVLRQREQEFASLGPGELPLPTNGNDEFARDAPDLRPAPVDTSRLIAHALVAPLPSALLAALALAAAAIAIALVPVRAARVRMPAAAREWGESVPLAIAVGFAGAMAIAAATLHWMYLNGVPHVPDAVAYLFQGKVLAGGRVAAGAPVPPESFDFFFPPMMWAEGDRWASVFPFGHSLALVPGVWLGAPWLVPALVAAGNVMLVFVLARRWHGALAGVLACLLYATSPFALMNAADFMAHNTAALYLLASIALTFASWRRAPLAAAGGGVMFGLLFNTRPLTAVALAPAFAIALLLMLRAEPDRRAEMRRIAAFAAGGIAMFGAYLLYNLGTTGDPLTSGYTASGQDVLGFRDGHSFAAGFANAHALLAVYAVVLNGWPAWIGLMLLVAPFALGTRDVRDWLLLFAIVSVMAAYTLFPGTAIAYGPRFWFETAPLAMILTARGALLLGERIGWLAERAAMRFGIEERRQWTGTAVVCVLVLGLAAFGTHAWLFSQSERWSSDGTPANARDLRAFNRVADGLVVILSDARFQNALIITEPCPQWQCFGTVFWMNAPDLDGRIVVARRVDAELRSLLEQHPGRRVFLADYEASVVYPYGARKPSPNEPLFIDMSAAPLAADVARTLGP